MARASLAEVEKYKEKQQKISSTDDSNNIKSTDNSGNISATDDSKNIIATDDSGNIKGTDDLSNVVATGVSEDQEENKDGFNVTIQPDKNPDFRESLDDIKDYSMNPDRDSEPAMVSETSGASIIIRKLGQINIASSKYAQMKLSPSGIISSSAIESKNISNRRSIETTELVMNHHKMNPNLYEFTDFKEIKLPTGGIATIGNFCVSGSVLVKAWEPELKRYMLIRRPCRMPMFGNELNVAEINPAINVDDPMLTHEEILAQSSQGYQVNALIQDAKSLIGKQGVDRSGINRYVDGMGDAGSGSSIGGQGGKGGGSNVTYGDASKNVTDGLAAAEKQLLGVRMDNGENGCAEAVTKIGSYYSPFLKQELSKGVVSVEKLFNDAAAAGVKIEKYDGGTLSAGDVIVYWDGQGGDNAAGYDHVVISDGKGGYIGNSSSRQQVVHSDDADSLGSIRPYYIIKTSVK